MLSIVSLIVQKVEQILVPVRPTHCYAVDFMPRDAYFDVFSTVRIGIDPRESDLVPIDSFDSPH
jgi:hypothetical protein